MNDAEQISHFRCHIVGRGITRACGWWVCDVTLSANQSGQPALDVGCLCTADCRLSNRDADGRAPHGAGQGGPWRVMCTAYYLPVQIFTPVFFCSSVFALKSISSPHHI